MDIQYIIKKKTKQANNNKTKPKQKTHKNLQGFLALSS